MRANRKSKWLKIAAAALLGCFVAGSAYAAVLVEADLNGWSTKVHKNGGLEVTTRTGKGWRATAGGDSANANGYLSVDLPSVGMNPKKGTFDFTLQRNEEQDIEALFTLLDAKRKHLLTLEIRWDGPFYHRGPEIHWLNSTGYSLWATWAPENEAAAAPAYWDTWIPFGTRISKGHDFRLTITWGRNRSENAIYINGRKVKAEILKDFGFSEILAQAKEMDIGHEYLLDATNIRGERYFSQMTTILKDFKVLDHPTNMREDSTLAAITSVSHNAARASGLSGKLVAGSSLRVFLEGTPGATATFDVARLANDRGRIRLNWGGWGVYPENETPGDAVDLRDVRRYRVYASREPFSAIVEGMSPVAALDVKEQSYVIDNVEEGVPYYVAVVAVMSDKSLKPIIMPKVGLPMTAATGAKAGFYEGTYQVDFTDDYRTAVIVGHLTKNTTVVTKVAERELEINTSLAIAVEPSPNELPADERSTSKVLVTVTDANGDPVSGHRIHFLLATTSQYTGVVGGGQFADQVGGTLSEDFWGETDLFGQAALTYTAGFAAKTAIVVARDMLTNDTGAGYIKTYIQAAAEIQLESLQEAAVKALGYDITVTSSDEWLTADGQSTARITATVTFNGEPVRGDEVSFNVSSGTGSIRTVSGTTDREGKTRAVYTAGKKIGMVLITAVDTTRGISGSVQIELRSDAPAKIKIKITPETLPADGHSTADLLVSVTDINDNPNEGVVVEYTIAMGSGRLRDVEEVTDSNGESKAVFVAGRVPGKVTVGVIVRSTEPTEDELLNARNLSLAVPDYDFF